MRVITHCPACQTQFFATEAQLNQHGGKVRCGQCMQVFDARAQLVSINEGAENITGADDSSLKDDTPAIDSAAPVQASPEPEPPDNVIEITAPETTADAAKQPAYLDDAIKNNRLRAGHTGHQSHKWLWAAGSLLMVLVAALQSVYFLRDEIAAIYYPQAKPLLVQVCQKLSCSINLPEKIESIAIDDSDMQEDADHPGLVNFASTLINSGHHVLAYPNLELTLTDVEDKPVLRRIFKPNEYLPAGTNIADGIQAGEETRIKLAISTGEIAVAGYRVFVTY